MLPTAITGTRQVEDYRQSIQHAGGEARIVDPSMPVAEALEGVGGLLLTGGEDVAPELYGEAPHPTVHVNRARDDFEIALIGEARRRLGYEPGVTFQDGLRLTIASLHAKEA